MADDTSDLKAGVGCLGILFLCGWFVWSWLSNSKLRYVVQYGASSERVTVEDRPENCDFDYAPIGKKGCHYDKEVVITKRGVDVQTKRRVISHDDGKTWDWDDNTTQPEGTNVSVYWTKVTH